ncbi:MAG: penicillin-binding protein 1A [Pseudomonadota bacterium]
MPERIWLPSWTLIRRTLIVLFILGVVALIALWAWVSALARDLPDYRKLAEYEPAITSRVHAGDGTLIAEFASEHRVFVPYESIPVHLVNAFTSAEDKKFFEHNGIDWLGMARGVTRTVINQITGDGGMQGGSTISQQVAKNMLLTRDQTIVRKVKEMVITRRMERAFTKPQIMELYLNEIYLGGNGRGENYYGVGSAALNYFGKSLPELNLAEAATLAALAQLPGAVNPYTNPERLTVRRNWVLSRMVVNGHISNEEADAAKAQPLETVRRLRGAEYAAAQYFVEELRRDLVDQYGEEALYEGGLSIRSTIDTRLQLAAQEALQAGLEAYDRRHDYRGPFANVDMSGDVAEQLEALGLPSGSGEWEAAAVRGVGEEGAGLVLKDGARVTLSPDDVKWASDTYQRPGGGAGLRPGDVVLVEVSREGDPGEDDAPPPPQGEPVLRQVPDADGALIALDAHTGRVLAMAGGYSFWKSQFNRVTQAKRQPGSSFKPFVYAAALEKGYTPVSKVLDAPFVDFDISTEDFWAPSNYSEGRFYGLSTMRVGLEQSRNLMTVRMAQDIGMEPVTDLAERVGLYEKLDPYLAMSLGAGELTMMDLAKGYATLVNGGKRVSPTFFDRVQDRYGRTLFRHDQRDCGYCTSDADWNGDAPPELEDNRPQVLDPVVAYQVVHMLEGVVERGTGRRAQRVGKPLAGKTGTTNDYVDAWFMGFSPDLVVGVWVGFDSPKTLGEGEAGGSVAAPVFTDFMEAALENEPPLPFRIPPGVRLVSIDAETGGLPTPATTSVITEAFRPGTEPGVAFEQASGLNIFGPSDGGFFGPPAEEEPVDPADPFAEPAERAEEYEEDGY